jgi:hypothetical protein
VLPDWLSHPETMQANVEAGKVPVDDLTVLDDTLRAKLAHNGITHLFPGGWSLDQEDLCAKNTDDCVYC